MYAQFNDPETTFLMKMNEIYGSLIFDYRKMKYINKNTEIKITCNKCKNNFEEKPSKLLSNGCPNLQCANHLYSKYDDEETTFLMKMNEIYGSLAFDYRKMKYIDKDTQVDIKCNKCKGILEETPSKLLSNGCPRLRCDNNKSKQLDPVKSKYYVDRADFNHQLMNIHGFKYTNIKFVDTNTDVTLRCNTCKNEFKIMPKILLKDEEGCPRCDTIVGQIINETKKHKERGIKTEFFLIKDN
jgi:hypothetical protein